MAKTLKVEPDQANAVAIGAALQELVNQGTLTEQQVADLNDRAVEFVLALLAGMVLIPNKETKRYDIVAREVVRNDIEEGDEGDLVIDA